VVVALIVGGAAIAALGCAQSEGVTGVVAWEPCLQEGLSLPRSVEAAEMVVLHGFSLFCLLAMEQWEEETLRRG